MNDYADLKINRKTLKSKSYIKIKMHEIKEKIKPDAERTGEWGGRSEGSARSTTEGQRKGGQMGKVT